MPSPARILLRFPAQISRACSHARSFLTTTKFIVIVHRMDENLRRLSRCLTEAGKIVDQEIPLLYLLPKQELKRLHKV